MEERGYIRGSRNKPFGEKNLEHCYGIQTEKTPKKSNPHQMDRFVLLTLTHPPPTSSSNDRQRKETCQKGAQRIANPVGLARRSTKKKREPIANLERRSERKKRFLLFKSPVFTRTIPLRLQNQTNQKGRTSSPFFNSEEEGKREDWEK